MKPPTNQEMSHRAFTASVSSRYTQGQLLNFGDAFGFIISEKGDRTCYYAIMAPLAIRKRNHPHKISGKSTKSAHPTSTAHRAMTRLRLFRTPSPKSLISRLPFSSCSFQDKKGLSNDVLVEKYAGPISDAIYTVIYQLNG